MTSAMTADLLNRARGCAVGAAVGDALGMPLEFGPRRPAADPVRNMLPGRLPAGSFTDDTEMALALAESLLAASSLDADDLARRFVTWYAARPPDVGSHTAAVLRSIEAGERWQDAVTTVQRANPNSAGNGSVMRCWSVALARWDALPDLRVESDLQSKVTHPHDDCVSACELVNVMLYHLLRGLPPTTALAEARSVVRLSDAFSTMIEAAPTRPRDSLINSGWVCHTVESAIWGLLTTSTFEDAVMQVANLGNDADTAASVVGALAGAAYGLDAIPVRWRSTLRGEWPLGSGTRLAEADFISLADRLVGQEGTTS